jgi:MFS family permease
MKNENSEIIIDKIINSYGYGWIIWKNFLICFIILGVEGFHNTYFGNVIIPLKSFYQIEDKEIQIISSIYFLFLGIGSYSTGYLTEKFKRNYILNTSMGFIAFGHVLMGATSNLIVFFVARLIIAYFLGVAVPVSLNLLTEYLPINHRSTVLTSVWLSYGIGQVYIVLLMLWIMPEYETAYFQKTVLISSSLSIFGFIIGFLLMQDSPRSLILNNYNKEAFEILEYMNNGPLSENEKEIVIAQIKSGSNKDMDIKISNVFSKDFFTTTLLLTFIWIICSIIFYGPNLIYSLTMKELEIEEFKGTNRDIIIQQIKIILISSPSTVIGGLLSEVHWLGRNKATNICVAIAIIFNFLTIYNHQNYYIHFSMFNGFTAMAFNINNTYSCEIYPTKVRDLAIGFLFAATRVGGFISQILYIYLNQVGTWAPYHFTTGLCVVIMVLIFLLPYETHGRPLDQEIAFEKLSEEVGEENKLE